MSSLFSQSTTQTLSDVLHVVYSLLAFISQFLDHLAKCEQAAIDIATFFETRA